MIQPCRRCTNRNRESDRFCPRCGLRLPAADAEPDTLALHEELFLLMHRDADGSLEGAAALSWRAALGGALLAELLLGERIALSPGKRQLVQLSNYRATGDDVLDDCLARIRKSSRPRNVAHWVSALVARDQTYYRIAEGLCRRGILAELRDKVLWFIPRTRYPQRRPGPEELLRRRLRAAIRGETAQVSLRTTLLLSLAKSAGLLTVVLPRKELRQHRQRIDQLVRGDQIGAGVAQAVAAIQAGMMTAATTAAVVAACSS